MPNFVTIFQFHVFSWIFVFLVAANCSFPAIGNNLLYTYDDIMSPSLSLSTLYGTVITNLSDDDFRFAVIMEWLLLKFMQLIFMMSMPFPFPWSGSYYILWMALLLALLQTSLEWLILLHFIHCFPYAGHHLSWWLDPQYLHFCLPGILTDVNSFLPFCFCSFLMFVFCQILSPKSGC